MAEIFSIASVTDAGMAALQDALDNGYAFTFTSMKTGNGSYTASEDVTGLTALKSLKNTYDIGSREDTEDGVTLGAVLTNYEDGTVVVSTDYNINEIGLFVTVNNVEYLYAIAAVPSDGGREMPAYDGNNLTQIIQSWHVPISNNANVQVTMSGILYTSSIVNALTSTVTTQPLSAYQGKVLKDLVDTKQDALIEGDGITISSNTISVDLVDNLTSDSATSALTAKQGKVLKTSLDTKQAALTQGSGITISENTISVNFENSLTSTSTSKALTANQGKVLNEAIATKQSALTAGTGITLSGSTISVKLEDSLTSTSTIKALTANQGKVLKDLVDTKSDASVVACYDESTALYTHNVDDIIYINGYLKKVVVAIEPDATIDNTNTTDAGIAEGTIICVENMPETSHNEIGRANADGSVEMYGSMAGGSTTAKSILTISTSITRLYGKTVTISDGIETITRTISSLGTASCELSNIGTYTVVCDIYSYTVNNAQHDITLSLSFPKIVTWTNGGDSDVINMIKGAQAGDITLSDHWSIGDERTINFASEVCGNTSAIWVLTDFDGTTSGGTAYNAAIHSKNCLSTARYMNSTSTNVDGWNSSYMRTTVMSEIWSAFNTNYKGLIKQASNISNAGNASDTNQTTNDYIWLFSEREVHGARTFSGPNEYNVCKQFKYFETSSNRIKTGDNGKYHGSWWSRSTSYITTNGFCITSGSGGATGEYATEPAGVVPVAII